MTLQMANATTPNIIQVTKAIVTAKIILMMNKPTKSSMSITSNELKENSESVFGMSNSLLQGKRTSNISPSLYLQPILFCFGQT
jgi:hypothetical protein